MLAVRTNGADGHAKRVSLIKTLIKLLSSNGLLVGKPYIRQPIDENFLDTVTSY